MLQYNDAYAAKHTRRRREPRWAVIIYFDDAKTDGMALLSHSDFTTGLGAEFNANLTVSPNGTAQDFNPATFSSSIGGLSIEFADPGNLIGAHIKANLDDGDGLRHKPVEVFGGYKGMAWVDFEQKAGMVCSQISHKFPGYSAKLKDVQIIAKQNILEPQTSTLTQSITDGASEPGQTVLPITDAGTSQFEVVERDASYVDGGAVVTTACSVTVSGGTTTYALSSGSFPDSVAGATMRFSGFTTAGNNIAVTIATYSATSITCTTTTQVTEAAGDTVTVWPRWSYVKLGDEVIKHGGAYTDGTYGVSLRVITRGALGTTAVAHDVTPGTAADRRPKVTEYITVEGPAVKWLYAFQTGVLYGQGGATLPDHWHLGISTDFIRLTDFEGIGADWWDTADPTKGRRIRGLGLERVDGKTFLEREICLWLGARMPIYVDGSWGLKRFDTVPGASGWVAELNKSNVIRVDSMAYDTDQVVNVVKAQWNWTPDIEDFNQTRPFVDADSISAHKSASAATYKFRLIHTSAQTDRDLIDFWERHRSRRSAPPWVGQVTCSTRIDNIEIGDAVLLNIPELYDFASGASLSRVYEVLNITPNYGEGTITYTLFGSTATPTPIDYYTGATRFDDDFYPGFGTDLDGTAGITLDGSGNITTTGPFTLPAGNYHVLGDLHLNGQTINTSGGTVWIAVRGEFIRGSGSINTVGQGKSGGTGSSTEANRFGVVGTTGFYGSPAGGGGIEFVRNKAFSRIPESRQSLATPSTGGNAPFPLSIKNNGTTVDGLPSTLDGSGGASGGNVFEYVGTTYNNLATGGNGAAGGGGLGIICRGFQESAGSGGSINLSGANGSAGGSYSPDSRTWHAGAGGGGAPGAFALFLDGAFTPPAVGSWLVQSYGATPHQGTALPIEFGQPAVHPAHSYFEGTGSIDARDGAFRTMFVPDNLAPEEQLAAPVHQITAPSAPTLSTTPLEPKTAADAGAVLQQIKVTVAASADPDFIGTQVQAKRNSESDWQPVSGAPDPTQTAFYFQGTQGVQYNVRARYLSARGEQGHSDWSSTASTTASASVVTIGNPSAGLPTSVVTVDTSGNVRVGAEAKVDATNAFNNEGIYWQTYAESLDGFKPSILLGGSVTIDTDDGYAMETDGTGGFAALTKYLGNIYGDNPSWAKSRAFKVRIKWVGTLTTHQIDVGVGGIATADTFFGFRIDAGDLEAVNRISSSETATTISSGHSSSDSMDLHAIWDASESEIRFYVNGALEATHSTNLPSGTANVNELLVGKIGGTSSPTLYVGDYRFVQFP